MKCVSLQDKELGLENGTQGKYGGQERRRLGTYWFPLAALSPVPGMKWPHHYDVFRKKSRLGIKPENTHTTREPLWVISFPVGK